LFPSLFDNVFSYGVISKAIQKGIINITCINLRDYSPYKHRITEDYPYGGGPGLVMKVEPIYYAVKALREIKDTKVLLLDPRGKKFSDFYAKKLSNERDLTFICGRYEGVDERVRKFVVDDEFSIGDYILSGGEYAAICMIDAISRYIPGVLGDSESTTEESFAIGGLEYPQYTRPSVFLGETVPDILLSGHHAKIKDWRKQESIKLTLHYRKDLLKDMAFQCEKGKIKKNQMEELKKISKNLFIGLMHYPMRDKEGDIVATALTNMDLHDISRTCKTYNVNKFYIINPIEAQRNIGQRIIKHWKDGFGSTYNENRRQAFEIVDIRESLLEVLKDIEEQKKEKPIIVATTARRRNKHIDKNVFFDKLLRHSVLLLFGTGWGFTNDFLDTVDYILEPIEGIDGFNHLSVRSAVAIILDRIYKDILEVIHEK
jgi:tRNA (guanine37-N1)-methyltransferase